MGSRLIFVIILFIFLAYSQHSWARNYYPEPIQPGSVITVLPKSTQQRLLIKGNKLVQKKVILDVTGPIPKHKMTRPQAQAISIRIKRLYINLGFLLVRVNLSEAPDRWTIHIDEGKLENIAIFGLGWYDTFKFRTTVLPESVFNVNTLHQNLQNMLGAHFSEASYELVDSRGKTPDIFSKITIKLGQALTSYKQLRFDTQLHRYSLYIYFQRIKQFSSFRPSLDFSSAYGVQLLAEYDKESLALKEDDFYSKLGLGVNRHSSINPASSASFFYPNLISEFKWFTPPFKSEKFRFYLDIKADYITDQRRDLPLDKYGYAHIRAAPVFEYQFLKNKFLTIAAGYDFINATAQRVVPSNLFTIPKSTQNALYSGLGLDLVFSRPQLFSEYNHKLNVEYSFYYRGKGDTLSEVLAKYQKIFFLRLFELRFKAAGLAVFNDIQFYDESYLRRLDFHSSFDRKYFIRKGLGLSFESRINVHGNKIQIGIFDDMAVFQHLQETSGTTAVIFGNSVGIGGYFLFFDAIQAYVTYAFGYNSKKETSHDVSLGLKKLF